MNRKKISVLNTKTLKITIYTVYFHEIAYETENLQNYHAIPQKRNFYIIKKLFHILTHLFTLF